MQFTYKNLLPLIFIFFLFVALSFAFSSVLKSHHIDPYVIIGSNVFFLLISFFSMAIQLRGMQHKNPHVFVRSVMSGMLMKMVLCVAAVIVYSYASGDAFNKKGIFISLFLYLIYLAVEVSIIMKLNKKPNA